MASSKEFLEYTLDLLREVRGVTYKKMMGEYILYKDGTIFGGIYDNRFLVKKVDGLDKYNLQCAIPYPKGSEMYLVDIENPDEIKEIVNIVVSERKGTQ